MLAFRGSILATSPPDWHGTPCGGRRWRRSPDKAAEFSIPYSLVPIPCSLLFPNILIPDFGMRGDEAFHQSAALGAVEIDHFRSVLAQPVETSRKGSALAHHQRANAELAHQSAAIPAGSKRGDHYQVAIA